uniref:Uncharacterized protein n=1 Tax=Knipowitschia caucasica TaxID=637954 RepID=A0AAV2JEC8_KNICA
MESRETDETKPEVDKEEICPLSEDVTVPATVDITEVMSLQIRGDSVYDLVLTVVKHLNHRLNKFLFGPQRTGLSRLFAATLSHPSALDVRPPPQLTFPAFGAPWPACQRQPLPLLCFRLRSLESVLEQLAHIEFMSTSLSGIPIPFLLRFPAFSVRYVSALTGNQQRGGEINNDRKDGEPSPALGSFGCPTLIEESAAWSCLLYFESNSLLQLNIWG